MKRIAWLLAITLLAGCAAGTGGNSSASSREESSASSEKVSEGKTVSFGNYQNESIKWYALDEKNGNTLLLSVHALDSRPFNDGPATWDNSSLRSLLNGEFYEEAFDSTERQKIQTTKLDNGDDLNYGTKAGQSTEDRVFLLSASQAQKFLSGKEKTTSPTKYAADQGGLHQ